MEIVRQPVTLEQLRKKAKELFGDMVKAVVDIERRIMAINGELHSDEEALLLEDGSSQENLWGINLYPDLDSEDWIEFDSLINLRPSQENMSRSVEDPETQKLIVKIVYELVKE